MNDTHTPTITSDGRPAARSAGGSHWGTARWERESSARSHRARTELFAALRAFARDDRVQHLGRLIIID